MDANNALQPASAHRPRPIGDDTALPAPPRWRLRGASGAAVETRAHVDLPLDGAGAAADGDADATDSAVIPVGAGVGAQATADPGDPQHAPRDAELWLLARRTQGAALRLDFELRSALARQVFRRDFVYVSRQLHALEASRRVQGLDRAALNDALAALQRRADDVQALLQRICADLQRLIDAHEPANARLTFSCPARFQATIVSPAARRFLALLTQADDTLARLEMAWLLGLVDPATRTALASDCRRALHGFKDLAADRRQAVGELVRQVNAQRRGARAADHEEGDDAAPDGAGR